jgi:Cu(I)/Ag(I) efflux system membrane fusion protein
MSDSPRTGRFGLPTLAVALLAGVALGGGLLALRGGHEAAHEHAAPGEAKPLYVCPMHPTITSDHPADCPICGMKLVLQAPAPGGGGPAGEHAGHGAAGAGSPGLATVTIDPQRQQLIGLRTAEVGQGPVGTSWRTVGKVAVDETRVHHVSIKVAGFAEQVYADYVGKPVRRGEPLFTIYSPDLLSVQQEYLLALRAQKSLAGTGADDAGTRDLVSSARKRLELWDIPEAELERLERTGKPTKTLVVAAPMSGVVTKKDLVMGHRLEEGAMPYEITDLGSVWVLADAYEPDLARIRLGMKATLTLSAFPNRAFQGRVIFVDPVLDSKSRTAKVRIEFRNADGLLRPEMYGEVTLQTEPRQALRAPTDAIIDSGSRAIVFVALGDGKFEPREVGLGVSGPDFVEVVSGLSGGEQVVTRAQFLVDSESRLRASLQAMGGGTR